MVRFSHRRTLIFSTREGHRCPKPEIANRLLDEVHEAGGRLSNREMVAVGGGYLDLGVALDETSVGGGSDGNLTAAPWYTHARRDRCGWRRRSHAVGKYL